MKKMISMLMPTLFSFCITTGASALQTQQQTHLKKDGTPDKRFKGNNVHKDNSAHLKKDGTPDKRFKENKSKKS